MSKLVWVAMPLLVYGFYLALTLLVRRQLPPRYLLNMQISLLLMGYLLATAGLGIFWVANQQLPVFDWHYLFGYGTLLLVLVHLYFNLPMVLRALRAPPRAAAPSTARSGKIVLALVLLAAAYYAGTRQHVAPVQQASTLPAGVAAVMRYHDYASVSRSGVFGRAPALDWGAEPADFKPYRGRPSIALARSGLGQRGLSESLRGAGARTQPLQLAELGELLYLSAGVTERRGGTALRAAPSSGALFSGELYVFARSVQGLAPGVYHYDADRHRLNHLGPLPALASGEDVTVALTSVVRRTAYKYKDRAYRYVTVDGGHLLENVRVASHAANMQAELVRDFDEGRLASALGVDGVEEIVLALVALRRGEGVREPVLSAVQAAALPDTGVSGWVHQATSLKAAEAPVPVKASSTASVRTVIEARRSQRRFSKAALAPEVLKAILADMDQPRQLSDAVRMHLVINRVQGMTPGVYRYERRQGLQLVRAGDFAGAAESAALSQAAIGDAAAVLILSARPESLLAGGARGYRQGLIEAGMIGERWLLGAVAHGLGACPVGAFYDDEAAALIGANVRQEWVLHFAALGVPEGA